MKCEDLRDSFVSGGSKRKYSGKPGSSQCYCHIIDRVLWIHRMLVTKRDLLFPQLLRLPSRFLGLVLPLHLCFSGHFVRLSIPLSEDFLPSETLGENFSFWSSSGSTTSPWYWCSPTAVSTLSSTPPSTASSRTASDV